MGIVRPTMELFPYSWIFFVPFIIVTSFAVLNLFIGIIVDAMQTSHEGPREEDREDIKEFTHDEVASLHRRLDELQQSIAQLNEALSKDKGVGR